jgi:transmembrane sensor
VAWLFSGGKERLRVEAAEWCARLSDASDPADRAAFEKWYSASPDHAEAYDRIAAEQRASRMLGESDLARQPILGSWAPRRGSGIRFALAGAAIAVAVLAVVLLGAREVGPGLVASAQTAAFATGAGAARTVVLADGSSVEMSPSSELRVAFSKGERRLRLDRGEARFSVAHEARRFVVLAGAAEVVAHGTVFVVRLDRGRATVSLIRGSVDVSYVERSAPRAGRRFRTLQPGERILVPAAAPQAPAPAREGSTPAAPTSVMLEFDDTPLSQAIEQANRRSREQIRLGDPSLANLRVTGAFRVGDSRSLAEALAAAFGLSAEEVAGGGFLLLPQQGKASPK